MRISGLTVCLIAAAACLPERGKPAVIEARVVHTSHAPTIEVPWWWRGASPPDAATCQQIAEGRVGELGGERTMVAVVAIDADALRLGDTTVLALSDGVVPAAARDDASITALATALTAAVERHNAYLAACGRTGDPIDVLLAAAPDTPQHTILAVMYTIVNAGIERTFLAVAGGRAGKRWKPGFDVEEEQLILTLAGDGWRAGIDWNRERDVAIADLAAVTQVLQDRRLGCANVPLRLGEPWSRTVGELDTLAGLGAHQFMLGSEEFAAPVARTSELPGARIALRVGGTVAALPHISPKIYPIERDSGDRHVRSMSPCVGLRAERHVPPSPGEIERMRELFELGRDDADVWDPLPGPK